MDTKTCSRCKLDKPLTAFYQYPGNGRIRSSCRPCDAIMAAESRDRAVKDGRRKPPKFRHYPKGVPQSVKDRNLRIKYRYGLTVEQFEQMYTDQKGKCATCLTDMDDPNIDHCHKSGKVRGLLCGRCNRALGQVLDNVSTLERMITYLGQV